MKKGESKMKMIKKSRRIITTEWYMRTLSGKLYRMRKRRIFLYNDKEGVIINDGRPVKLIDGKWVYEVK